MRLIAPTRAEIDLEALRHNLDIVQGLAGDATVMAVVKADAYGHGAVPIARELRHAGVIRFAVATLSEAIELRDAGIDEPILVFSAALPESLPLYSDHRLGVTVATEELADEVIRFARTGRRIDAHLKIDTGMRRIGVTPEVAEAVASRLIKASGVELTSVWTHLATADDQDSSFVEQQIERFRMSIASLRDDVPFSHVANSGALLSHRDLLDLNARTLVRPGISLYGLSPSPDVDLAREADLHAVMRLVSVVTQVKEVPAGSTVSYSRKWTAESDRMIATVAVGYADGFPRILTNRGSIGLDGKRYPVAGTVCMDMTMVDLGEPAEAMQIFPGSEAVIFGDGGPSCFDLAQDAGTITYEIACRVSRRVPRGYLNALDAS